MEHPSLTADGSRLTRRLRLRPAGPANAADLWLVHNDDNVWPWYGTRKPSLEQARQQARFMGESWHWHGVHKWIAYDRVSGEVVGRGGLSRTPVDDDWGQIYPFLPARPWVRVAHEIRRPFRSSHSASSRHKPWCHAPSGTTRVRAPSWNASACGTRAKSAAAA